MDVYSNRWETLFERVREYEIYDIRGMSQWVEEVKAIGDGFRDKASTLDELTTLDNMAKASLEINESLDELSAVRTVLLIKLIIQRFTNYIPGGEMWDAGEYGKMLDEIKGILS